MRLSLLNEDDQKVEILYIDPEEEWELAGKVEQISNMVGIHFMRNKDVRIIAMVGDEVVGGVADVVYDDDGNQTYDFDVVVHPKWQGPSKIGFKLIDAAIENAKSLDAHVIKTWVVNSRLLPIMVNKYGFEGWDEQYSPKRGRSMGTNETAILYKYI